MARRWFYWIEDKPRWTIEFVTPVLMRGKRPSVPRRRFLLRLRVGNEVRQYALCTPTSDTGQRYAQRWRN